LKVAKQSHHAQHRLNKLKQRVRVTGGFSWDSVAQLQTTTDAVALQAEIAAGTISKSTDVMIAWIASADSTSAIKEIHVLAGGEEGVRSGRTFVYDISAWTGYNDWANTYTAELAKYGTVDLDAGTLSWKIRSMSSDEPTDDQCTAFAAAVAAGDLTSALIVASSTYQQDLDESAVGLEAHLAVTSVSGVTLLAERLDMECLGYKFFSYQDSPSASASDSQTALFSD
jgi:hypothetical protein